MNKVFKIVWNRAMRQFVVASELARAGQAGSTDKRVRLSGRGVLARGALATALMGIVSLGQAHTVSVGYIAPLGSSNTITFWYGTYHTVSDSGGTITYEGQFHLTGGTVDQTVDFSQIAGAGQADPSRPVGLEDGTNNFYATSLSGTTLTGTPPSAGAAMTWQGVTFTGLAAGTYTYSYIPIATPSSVWSPYQAVLSNTLVITAADLNGYPMLPGHTYTQVDPELNQPDSIVFNGGIYAPTENTINSQPVTIRSGDGTVDTTGGNVTFTGGVDGTGTLTKAGTGTLVLNGPSSYTGGTVVAGGTLQGDTTSLRGDITDNATVAFNQSTSGTYAGILSGAGNLVTDGSGTLTLTGANTYTGVSTIDAGSTLALGGNGSIAGSSEVHDDGTFDISGAGGDASIASLAGAGTVALGGNSLDLTHASGTFNGTLDGNGGLNVRGGSESLAGTNTYASATNIDSGATLALIGDGSIAASSGVTDNGTFDISGANGHAAITTLDGTGTVVLGGNNLELTDASGSFGGTIAGTGGLDVQGGTEVLTGANTYAGGTTIEGGGTLEIGSGASLGAAGTSVTMDDGTLRLDGSLLVNHDFVLDGQGTVETSNPYAAAITGAVSGAGDFVKAGDGLLTATGDMSQAGGVTVNGGLLNLMGDNTYQGDTTVSNGWLQIHSDANLGAAGSNLVLDGGGLDVDGNVDSGRSISLLGSSAIEADAGNSFTTSGDIGGTGTLAKYGDGMLLLTGTLSQNGGLNLGGGTTVLTGDNTFVGMTQLYRSTLQIDNNDNLGDAANSLSLTDSSLHTTGNVDSSRVIGIGASATFDVDGGTTLNQSGPVLGTGTLVKDGAGVADFSGVLAHTGGTVVNDGTLILGGTNTYTGGTTLNGGTLQIADDANLGDTSGGLTFDGGTLHVTGDIHTSRAITLAGNGTVDVDAGTTLVGAGDLGGIGALIKNGAGEVEFSGALSHTGGTVVNDGTLVLGGTNSYAGGTTLNGGTLQVGSDANLGDSHSGLTFDGGTLHTTGSFDTGRNISLAGDGHFDTDANTTLTATDAIDGSGRLLKQGDGTLVLSGANSYTGGTSIDAGTLQGDSTSLQGNITDDGTLDFVQAGSGSFVGNISGTGALVKDGQGTLVLAGSNTYTGGTTLDDGVLQVDRDANLGDVASDLTLNGGTLHTTGSFQSGRDITLGGGSFSTDAGTTFTSAGAMGGTGALVKDGQGTLVVDGTASHQGGTIVNAGTLVLAGSNTYTGGTTVNGGTLQVSRDANLGDASSDLTLDGGTLHTTASFQSDRDITLGGGSFSTDAGTTFTSTGAMGGNGGLVKNGLGTLVVDGTASHQGGTIVNAGTLVLAGNNTYTGGTTLNGGSLQVSSDANLGSAGGSVTFNGGDLTLTQTMSSNRNLVIEGGNASITTLAGVVFTANGDMSGTGGLVKQGAGTLVVRGDNTFTGGTLIDGGVIKIDSGSSLGTGAILLQGGTLQTVQTLGTGQTVVISGDSGVNVDAGTTTVLSGQLVTGGNAGCFVKSGKGTLDMTGTATLANGTCVQDGMLRANGELASQVQVDAIGWLRGVGHITGSINVDGTLAPGNSPGTLTVSNAVTMHAGSTLEIDVDGYGTGTGRGNYSRLLVGGVFTAAGTLAPVLRGITGNASNAFTPELGDTYTIVQAAGGVTGTFDALRQPSAGLAANTRFQVFYVGGHAVELFVTPASYVTLLAGANGNTVRAGAAIDQAVIAQDAGTDSASQHGLLFALAGLRAAQLPQVIQDLAGEAHAQTAALAREASLGLAGDMTDHLSESPLEQGERGSRAWATLSQGGYRALSDAQAAGFHSQQSRVSAGLDAYRGDAAQWGVGLAHTEARLEDVPASGNVRGNGVMAYGEVAAGRALLDGTASWSKDQWSTRRADPIASLAGLSAQADGHSMAAGVTARLPLQHEGMRIEPYLQAVWQRVERDGVTEAGDALTELTLGRYQATGTRVLAGLNLGSAAQDPLASTLTYRVGAAVGHDFGDTLNPVLDASLADESFSLRAPSVGRTLLKLDASGTLRLGKQSYLYGGLNSATGHDRASYGVNVGVRVQF